MQRRAEVGAVEWIDTGRSRHPSQRARLTRGNHYLRVIRAEHAKPVYDVPVLLDVGDVEVHGVAELHALEIVGREVTANRDQVDVNILANPPDPTCCL